MVRTYKKKTLRDAINENDVNQTMGVLKKKKSIRQAALDYNLKASTLQHRLEKFKRNNGELVNEASDSDSACDTDYVDLPKKFQSKYTSRQVFTVEEENQLEEYLIKPSNIHYGLTFRQARILAYEYACHLPNCSIPPSWLSNNIAGLFWIQAFMKRHPKLSLRRPENTALGRATAFNRHNVNEFFTNYLTVMEKYNFTPDRIFNIDETGITTVLETPRVIAETGKKQVGQAVSAERGQLVIFCGIISAVGRTVPPVFIFPRIRYKDYFLNGAPSGSIGLPSKSGWMTNTLFLEVLKHVQKNPILILLDNHESHCSIEAIIFARENGIVLLSFPPHTSHKLQPLDVTIYSSFKSHCKTAFNDWMVTNPRKTISIYDIPSLANKAYLHAFTPKNILRGFEKPGLWPINQLAFNDQDFLSSYVTDREKKIPANEGDETESKILKTSESQEECVMYPDDGSFSTSTTTVASTSSFGVVASTSSLVVKSTSASKVFVTPEFVRPFPKAKPRVSTSTRKKGKSRIYTSTPEKERIMEITQKKQIKTITKTLNFDKKNDIKKKNEHLKSKNNKKKKKADESSSSESNIKFSDSDSIGDISDDMEEYPLLNDDDKLSCGDYVLVRFASKKSIVHYVGLIIDIDEGEFEVNFLRRQPDNNKFVFPVVQDISPVSKSDIVLKLSSPMAMTGSRTERQTKSYKFAINFDSLNIVVK